jgi:hypothetical protein
MAPIQIRAESVPGLLGCFDETVGDVQDGAVILNGP